MFVPLRFAAADIELGDGVTIRTGELILVGFGCHGRDAAVNAEPNRFDIDRKGRAHLAFGHGIRFCHGAPLVRLESRIALEVLFTRFLALRLAGGAEPLLPRISSFVINGYREVPVIRVY